MYVNVLTQKDEVNPSSPHKTPDNFFSEKIKNFNAVTGNQCAQNVHIFMSF